MSAAWIPCHRSRRRRCHLRLVPVTLPPPPAPPLRTGASPPPESACQHAARTPALPHVEGHWLSRAASRWPNGILKIVSGRSVRLGGTCRLRGCGLRSPHPTGTQAHTASIAAHPPMPHPAAERPTRPRSSRRPTPRAAVARSCAATVRCSLTSTRQQTPSCWRVVLQPLAEGSRLCSRAWHPAHPRPTGLLARPRPTPTPPTVQPLRYLRACRACCHEGDRHSGIIQLVSEWAASPSGWGRGGLQLAAVQGKRAAACSLPAGVGCSPGWARSSAHRRHPSRSPCPLASAAL